MGGDHVVALFGAASRAKRASEVTVADVGAIGATGDTNNERLYPGAIVRLANDGAAIGLRAQGQDKKGFPDPGCVRSLPR